MAHRNRSIDIAAAAEKGIVVTGTTYSSNGTLEHIWALILAAARHIVIEDANIKSRKPQWQSVVPTHLGGKTMGILGLGRLGTQVANVCQNLKVNLIGQL